MLLRLSSFLKFSQNLKRHEDDSSSTPPFDIYLPYIYKALRYCQNWCGLLLFYPQSRQCEKPEKKGKTNIVPTPYFFIRFLGGIKKAYLIKEYDIYYCIFHFDNHVEND